MIGVSIFGALLLAHISDSIGKLMPGAKVDLGEMQRMALMASETGAPVPAGMQEFIAKAISDAMSYIFMGSLLIVAVAFVAILFIPVITLRGRGPGAAGAAADLSPTIAPTDAAGAKAVRRGEAV
jgi:hypothetical protein